MKHLQTIEEQILESRAWAKDSPLWEAIERDPNGVPVWEDVALPSSSHSNMTDVTASPLSHHGRGFSIKCKFDNVLSRLFVQSNLFSIFFIFDFSIHNFWILDFSIQNYVNCQL